MPAWISSAERPNKSKKKKETINGPRSHTDYIKYFNVVKNNDKMAVNTTKLVKTHYHVQIFIVLFHAPYRSVVFMGEIS